MLSRRKEMKDVSKKRKRCNLTEEDQLVFSRMTEAEGCCCCYS
jgi:hypothetical protein